MQWFPSVKPTSTPVMASNFIKNLWQVLTTKGMDMLEHILKLEVISQPLYIIISGKFRPYHKKTKVSCYFIPKLDLPSWMDYLVYLCMNVLRNNRNFPVLFWSDIFQKNSYIWRNMYIYKIMNYIQIWDCWGEAIQVC